MRQRLDPRTNAQAAAFALFESLRGLAATPLAARSDARVTCVGAVDPTACGLVWVNEGDAALQLAVTPGHDAPPRGMWVHAASDLRGSSLTVYVQRERPALTLRFAGQSFVAAGPDRWRLRERPLFSSADRHHDTRAGAARRLASAWEVALDGPWLVVGEWDALEGAWDPDAARRTAAIAWLLEAVRGEG